VGVFMCWRMKCVGCPFGLFHSVEHACGEHGIEPAKIVAALQAAIG